MVARNYRAGRCTAALVLLSSSCLTPAYADPAGGQVVSGAGAISQTAGSTAIDQSSDRIIIQWDSFDTQADETVQFIQPDSDSAALNRVMTGGATSFDGSLFANGNVLIINPSGVHFGENAMVDVGGLVASSAGIGDDNFMAGRLIFDQQGQPYAVVTNSGAITARDGGLVALVAPGVQNTGVIQADLGAVVLGSGETFAIDPYGDGLVSFAITGSGGGAAADGGALVTNSGRIQADGGTVILSAQQMSGLVDNAINMSGVVQANSVGVRDGVIVLYGGDSGAVNVTGQISAQGLAGGEQGGTVHVTGESAMIGAGARIDASGQAGGGTILIGGARQGGARSADSPVAYSGNGAARSVIIGDGASPPVSGAYRAGARTPRRGAADLQDALVGAGTSPRSGRSGDGGAMPRADNVGVSADAVLAASAGQSGDGGEIVVWADGATRFDGTAIVRGGAAGGDGGFVETSGLEDLIVGDTAYVDALAPNGAVGDWLLDPRNIEVAIGGGATLGQAADDTDTTTDITIAPSTIEGAAANVTLWASEDITFTDPVAMANAGVGLTARAGDEIFVNADVATNNGDITLIADDMEISAAVDAGTGTILIDRATLGLIGLNRSAGGSLQLSALELAQLSAQNLTLGRADPAENKVQIVGWGEVDVSGNIPGVVTLNALGDVGSYAAGWGGTLVANEIAIVSNIGVTLFDNTGLTSTTGDIFINANADGFETDPLNESLYAVGANTAITSAGDIEVIADHHYVDEGDGFAMFLTAAGEISFARATPGGVSLGADDESGLAFSDHELSHMSAARIIFGDAANTTSLSADGVDLSAIDDVQLVSSGGMTIGGGNIFGALYAYAGSLLNLSGTVESDGGQQYAAPVNLTGAAALTSTGAGDIAFNSTIDGAYGLTVNTGGVTSFLGQIGGTTALASLTTDAGGGTDIGGGLVDTSGDQFYGDFVYIDKAFSNTTLTSTGGDIEFTDYVAGRNSGFDDLTIQADGTVTARGPLGRNPGTGEIVGALQVSADAIELYDDVFGADGVVLDGAVTLQDTVNIVAGDDLELHGSIDGQHRLWMSFIGDATIDSVIGANDPLLSFQIVPPPVTDDNDRYVTYLGSGSVTTVDSQLFGGDLVLTADTILTSTGGGDIQIGTVDGAYALTANTSGATRLVGAVGGATPLVSLTTDAGGSTLIDGRAITLSGNTATFNDAVILEDDTTITDAGAVTFNSTVDSDTGETNALTVTAGGDVTFGGAVGGTNLLSALTADSGGALTIGGAVYTDNGDILLSADAIAINAAMDAGTGMVALAPHTAGREIYLGEEDAAYLSLTDAEFDLITAGLIRVGSANAGSIILRDIISPAGTDTLSLITGDRIQDQAANAANATDIGDISVANLALSAVNGIGRTQPSPEGANLELDVDTVAAYNSTTGAISLTKFRRPYRAPGGTIEQGGASGDTLTLGAVDGVIGVRSDALTTDGIEITSWVGDDLIITEDVYTDRGSILLTSKDGDGNHGAIFLQNGAAITANNGDVALQSNNFHIEGGTISAPGNRQVTIRPDDNGIGDISLGGADGVDILGLSDAELDNITAGELVIGHGSLARDIYLAGPIDPANVDTLTVIAGGSILDATATEQADITVDTLTLSAGDSIGSATDAVDVDAQTVSFDAVLTGALAVTNVGEITLDTAVSADSVLLDGSVINLNAGAVHTAGAQTYDGPIALGADTTLTSAGGGDITFASSIEGANALTVNTQGVTVFAGAIGQNTPLASLTTDSGGTTRLNYSGSAGDPNLRTTGGAVFGDSVILGGNLFMANLANNADDGGITFGGTLDGDGLGNRQIAINTRDAITLNGAVGSTVPVGYMQLRGADGIFINGGAVTSTAGQLYFGHVVLGTDTVLTSTTNNTVSFNGLNGGSGGGGVDGAYALTVNTQGVTEFNTPVGGATPLASLTTNAGGTTIINGGTITLDGNSATFNDAVVLNSGTVIADSGAVTFNNTLDSESGETNFLIISATGDITFNGVVGSVDRLSTLNAGSSGTVTNAAAVNTTGAISLGGYDGVVVNGALDSNNSNITLRGNDIELGAAVNAGTAVVGLLPIAAGREISLGAETAGSLSLTDAEIDLVTAGTLRIGSANAGSITFYGAISPAGANTLSLITGDAILDDNNVGADVQVANLALQAVNGIGDNQTLATNVTTLAALNTADNAINLIETYAGGDLIVGAVDGVVGVVNQASGGHPGQRAIGIETNDGDLIIAENITSLNGGIFLVAQEDNGGAGDSVFTNNAAITMHGTAGQIQIFANNMDLGPLSGGSIVALDGARVVLTGDPASTVPIAIDLGGADGANLLGLTEAELGTITTAGVLQIGGSGSGNISVTDTITLDPLKVATLSLETSGAVLDGNMVALNPLSVDNLAIRSGTGIGTTNDLDLQVKNLAFLNAANGVNIRDEGSLTIASIDGLAASANNGGATNLSIQDALTFASDASSAGAATYSAATITVDNGIEVASTGGQLGLGAPTINLDGNLSGASGILGTATTINVISDTGGAEIQDAVDVALSLAAASDNVTVNIGPGTYDSFVVSQHKTNLTVAGAGAGTIVETGSPAITISANGTTVQDMLLTYGGSAAAADVGILLNGDAPNGGTTDLTGIDIVNVDFVNLSFGVLSVGDIGDGNLATTDVTIRGNSSADKFIFEDMTQAAVALGDSDGDAVYVLRDAILQDGADPNRPDNNLAAEVDGIAFGQVGAVTIQGVEMIDAAQADAIFVGPLNLTNTQVQIGGPNPEDANILRSNGDGIDFGGTTGSTVAIQGNSIFAAAGGGVEFNGDVSTGSTLTVADNTIQAGQDGLYFDRIVDASVTLSGNIVDAQSEAVRTDGLLNGGALTIADGTYDGAAGALLVDNSGVAGADGSLNLGSANYIAGLGANVIEVITDTGNAGVGVDFAGGATISGGANGLVLTGPGIDILNDTLGAIALSGQSGDYVQLSAAAELQGGAPVQIDATDVSFDGASGPGMTPAQLNATEDRLVHYPDNLNSGVLNISDLFVVNGESIQYAVNAAGLLGGPQTVVVGDGVFAGSVEVWVDDLTLVGNGDTSVIDTDMVDAFANDGNIFAGFGVWDFFTGGGDASGATGDVSGVTIDGFRFTDSTSAQFNGGVILGTGGFGTSTAIGTTVVNASFEDLFDAVWLDYAAGDTRLQSLTGTDLIVGVSVSGLNGGATLTLADSAFTVDAAGLDVFGAVGGAGTAVTVTGSTLAGGEHGALFDAAVRNGATVTLGGTGPGDANTLTGGDYGVRFARDVDDSTVAIVGNTAITGADERGLRFRDIETSTVRIADNVLISGDAAGVQIRELLAGTTLTVDGNTQILGPGGAGIQIEEVIGSRAVIADNAFIRGDTAGAGAGVVIDEDVEAGAELAIVGNGEISGDAGIVIGDDVLASRIDIAGNTVIQASDFPGILIFDNVETGSVINIGPATVDVAGVATAYLGNTTIASSNADGIAFNDVRDSTVSISDNDTIRGDGFSGVWVEDEIRGTSFTVARNQSISGPDEAIAFAEVVYDDSTVTIDGNGLNGAADGVRFYGAVKDDSDVSVANNQIGASGARLSGDGVRFDDGVVDTATVTLEGNSVYVDGVAVRVADLQSPSTLSIIDGTYDGTGGALLVDNSGVAGSDGRLNTGSASYAAGAGANVIEAITTGGDAGLMIDFGGGATVAGGANGVVLAGPGIDVLNDTFGTLAFSGQSGDYIQLADGAEYLPGSPTVLQIQGASFDGQTPGAMSFADLIALEGALTHFLDNGATGLLNYGALVVPAGNSIQLAVNAAGALTGPQTVLVDAGTFGGSVELWVPDLTVAGLGDATVIDANAVDAFANLGDTDTGFLVDASGVTVQDMAVDGTGGPLNLGILVDGTLAPGITGIAIRNVNFANLFGGVFARGDIGAGAGTFADPDILIAGDSAADRATFTDIAGAAITADDAAGSDAVYTIDNIAVQDGPDGDSVSAQTGVAAAGHGGLSLTGSIIADVAGAAVDIVQPLAGAVVNIGGPNAADANTLSGQDRGIRTLDLDGVTMTIAGNTLIEGQGGDALQTGGVLGGSAIVIEGNARIAGAGDALAFGDLDASTVWVANNPLIEAGQDGANAQDILNGATLTVADNARILAGDNGVLFFDVAASAANILRNGLVQGGADGVRQSGAITGGGAVSVADNATIRGAGTGLNMGGVNGGQLLVLRNGAITGAAGGGVAVSNGATGGALVRIADNGAISGGADGVSLAQLADSTLTVSGNDAIAGAAGAGVRVTGPAVGSSLTVDGNGVVSGGAYGVALRDVVGGAVSVGGNNTLTGGQAGVSLGNVTGATVRIAGNTMIEGTGPGLGRGIAFDGDVSGADVSVTGNDQVRGARAALAVLGDVIGGAVDIAGNVFTGGSQAALAFEGGIADADIDVSGNTLAAGAGDGLAVSGALSGDADLAISGNQFGSAGARFAGDGLALSGGVADTATVTLSGDTIYAAGRAIDVADLQSPSALSIVDGIYDGTGGALRIDNSGAPGADGRVSTGSASYVAGGGARAVEVVTGPGGAGVDIDFAGGAAISGGADGVVLSGPGIDVLNDTFGALAFAGQADNYIVLADGAEFLPGAPTVIDIQSVSFDGQTPGAMSPAELTALETSLVHYLDNGATGLLNYGALVVPDGESIQLAVNAAGALGGPQTVLVDAGVFGGSVELWVDDLTLLGQGGATVIDADAVDAFANNGDVDAGFQIAATSALSGGGDVSGVWVDGFAITGGGGNTGIALGGGASAAGDTALRNLTFDALADGVVAHSLFGETALSNVAMTNIAARGVWVLSSLGGGDQLSIADSQIASGGQAVRFDGALDGARVSLSGLTADSGAGAVLFADGLTDAEVEILNAALAAAGAPAVAFADTVSGGSVLISSAMLSGGGARFAALDGDADIALQDVAIGSAAARVSGDGVSVGGLGAGASLALTGGTVFAEGRGVQVSGLQGLLLVSGGAYDGTNGAVVLDNRGVAGADGRARIDGAALTGGPSGRVLALLTDGAGAGLALDMAGGGSSITGGQTGLRLSGAGVDIVGDDLGDTRFAGQSGDYIELADAAEFLPGAPSVIDITDVRFNGKTPGQMSFAELIALENALTHYLDNGSTGLLNAGALVVPDGASIQLAVNAAGVLGGPQTVTVDSGVFGGSVELWVDDLTLMGQGASSVIDAAAADPFANNGDVDIGLQIAAASGLSGGGDVSNVTVDGFAISGAGAQTGVALGGGGSQAGGVTLRNLGFDALGDGVVVTDMSGAVALSNIAMTNIAAQGVRVLPVLGAGDSLSIADSDIAADGEAVTLAGVSNGASVTVSNSRIGAGGRAIRIDDLNGLLSIAGSAVDGADGAVWVDNRGAAGPAGMIRIGSAQLSADIGATVLTVLTDAGNAGAGLDLSPGGVRISGGATGMRLSGPGADLVGDDLYDLAFSGQSDAYIVLAEGAEYLPGAPTIIDARNVDFDGLDSASIAGFLSIEDGLTHYFDNPTLGLILVHDFAGGLTVMGDPINMLNLDQNDQGFGILDTDRQTCGLEYVAGPGAGEASYCLDNRQY